MTKPARPGSPASAQPTRICPIDRKPFQPQNKLHKFCSSRCLQKDKRKRYRTADYNTRFETAADYVLVQKAAARAKESMNEFIITAAVNRAKAA